MCAPHTHTHTHTYIHTYIHTYRVAHIMTFVTPAVEHWLEQEIAPCVHPRDRSLSGCSTRELHLAAIMRGRPGSCFKCDCLPSRPPNIMHMTNITQHHPTSGARPPRDPLPVRERETSPLWWDDVLHEVACKRIYTCMKSLHAWCELHNQRARIVPLAAGYTTSPILFTKPIGAESGL